MSESTYTTVQGDMWDWIAYRLYGTESAMTVLLRANHAYMNYAVFPAGIVLTVPAYSRAETSHLPPWRQA